LVEEDVTMTIVTQRRTLLAPSKDNTSLPLPLPMSPRDRTPVWQRFVVLSITLALTGTLGAVTWAELRRHPMPKAPQPASSEFPIRLPEATDFTPGTMDAAEAETDEATLLLEEVNRLLRLADALDVEIDRLSAQAPMSSPDEDSNVLSKLPEAEHLMAMGPDTVLLAKGAGVDDAPLPQVPAVAVASVLPGLAAVVARPAERVAPVEAAVASVAVPPEAPVAETAGAAETASGVIAAAPAMARAAAAPPAARPRLIAAVAARGTVRRPVPAAAAAKPSAAQRRCQLIAVRFQMGTEPSEAEQRFLRRSCR
jgi:hypothetical protein